MIVDGSLAWRNHRRLRDAPRIGAELRERYSAAKKRVGAAAVNIEESGQSKNAVIQPILAAAGLTYQERRVIDAAQASTPASPARRL